MRDKVVVVTGGGQGIGLGIASRLVEAGARMVLAEIDAEAGAEAESRLKALGSGGSGQVHFIETDVSDDGSVSALMAEVSKRFGRLDGLVNNAGIFEGGPLREIDLESWRRVLAVNLTGPFLCARHAAAALEEAGGAIVNIASTRALMSEADCEAYAASKGGIVALTHAMAVSLGPRVRVNCVSPGWIEVGDWKKASARVRPSLDPEDHEQHPAGRVGRPEDVASLVAWLLSEEAAFVTGANFTIDGGMTRKMIYV